MKKFLIFLVILALLSTMLLPLLSLTAHGASVPIIPQPDLLPGPLQTSGSDGGALQNYFLNSSIPKAINIGLGLLGIAAFMGILISAIQMLTALGKEDQINRAKTNVRYSVLGFIIAILSYAIVSIIVSVSLPTSDSATSWFATTAYAVDVEDDVDLLLPSANDIITSQDAEGRVSLPSGDFLGEILPAVVTNIMYLVAFLIFIGFVYGGTLMVIGRGNEEETTKAKNIILYAAIAMALISLGYAIIYGVANLRLNQDPTTSKDDTFTNSIEQ